MCPPVSQQNRGVSCPKVWFSWVSKATTFWPPPLLVEDLHPTGRYLDLKLCCLIYKLHVMTAKISPPEIFYVIADSIQYTEKSRHSKCNFLTRNRLQKQCNEPKLTSHSSFMYVMLLRAKHTKVAELYPEGQRHTN